MSTREVTDAMVARAVAAQDAAFFYWMDSDMTATEINAQAMRAALLAALTPPDVEVAP